MSSLLYDFDSLNVELIPSAISTMLSHPQRHFLSPGARWPDVREIVGKPLAH